jgi:hypothetical protein
VSLIARMAFPAFAVYVTKALGRNKSLISVATSAILVITSFFYIYTLGSYFKIGTSVLRHFYNYVGFFHSYVVGKEIDHIVLALGVSTWIALAIKRRSARITVTIIYLGLTATAVITRLDMVLDILALLSIPLLVSILAFNRFAPKVRILNKEIDTDLSSNYIVILGLFISTASLIASLTPFFFTSSSGSMPIHNYGYEIFVLFSSFFSPLLMTLLIFCVPIKLLFDRYIGSRNKIKMENKSELQYVSKNADDNYNSISKVTATHTIPRAKTIFYLSLFMALSATIALIPHLPAVNKDNRPVGADIGNYIIAIRHLSSYSNNPQELIRHAFVKELPFYGDRPVSLLLFYAAVKVVPADARYVIDYSPLILGPALVLAIFFLTREMTSNDTISILAAFMTSLSFQVLVGIYSGFYANWFALIIGSFSFVFLFRFLKRPTKSNFIIYSILVILLLLTHVYTWSMVAVVTVLFLLVMLKLRYYRRKSVLLLLLVVLSPAIIDAARTAATGAVGGISSSLEFAPKLTTNPGGISPGLQFFPQSSLAQLASFRVRLLDTTEHFLGGLFGNFIILALGLYWLFRSKRAEPYNIFIMIFLSIGIVPLLFSDWVLQTRVLYNVPFQIPAAIALYYVLRQQQTKGLLTLLPICIWLIAISIVNVSNFYLVPPPPHHASVA